MLLSDLDGFLTGVICSPVVIMPSEWLPKALGRAPAEIPLDIIDLVMERYNEIVGALNATPPYLEPAFWQAKDGHVIAMAWCEGFMDAIELRKKDWADFCLSDQGKKWLKPIMDHLFDENFVSRSGISDRNLDAHLDHAAHEIPEVVPQIFIHWQAQWAMRRSLH
jgi:uncharacterized protein